MAVAEAACAENISSAKHKTKNISHPGAPDRKSRDAGIFLRIFIRKPPNYQLE